MGEARDRLTISTVPLSGPLPGTPLSVIDSWPRSGAALLQERFLDRLSQAQYVSRQTQALFDLLTAAGTDPASLTALVSSAYADGGNHVLDELEVRSAAGPALG